MECRIGLDPPTVLLQTGTLLGDTPIPYYEYARCGYVKAENPVWLGHAYASAMNDSRTGVLLCNQANAQIVLGTMFLLGKLGGRVVNRAGGYGILVRLLIDYGAKALDKLRPIAPNVLLSTEIIAGPAPKQDNWWYYGKDHGQHIGFFRLRTLVKLAKERGKFLLSDGHSYHLITTKYISPLAWKMLLRLNKLVPLLLRHRLTSKTSDDCQTRISALRSKT